MKRKRTVAEKSLLILGYLALLAPLSLAGCAQQRQWTHQQGLHQATFDQDAAQCRREAAKATYRDPFGNGAGQGQNLEHSVAQEKLFEQCMFSKGYRLKSNAPKK